MAFLRVGTSFAVGNLPQYNAAADINNDGNVDLMFANYNDNSISVFLGDGLGGFSPGAVLAENVPGRMVLHDFDGDGFLDLVATLNPVVKVFFNDHTGNFPTATTISAGVWTNAVALGDVDGDGESDLVSVAYGAGALYVMHNDGAGASFTLAAGSPISPGGPNSQEIVLADFNGDSHLDIAVVNSLSDTVGILLNDGSGNFGTPTQVSTSDGSVGLASGDLNGDGKIDLVAAGYDGASATVLLGDGAGGFTTRTVATGNNPFDVALADMDGDGDLDMVVSNRVSNTIGTYLNDGAANFAAAAGGATTVGTEPLGIVLADFDNDGDFDVSTTDSADNRSTILINTASTYSVSSSTSASEGGPGAAGELVFTISRTAKSEAENVTYTLGGTATSGIDYTAPGGTISFAAGQKTAEVRIAILADSVYEAGETVTLTLAAASGNGSISATAASRSATIIDGNIWVNTAPVGASSTIAIDEDTSHTFAADDFGFSDADGNAFSAVVITTLPQHGMLQLDGVDIVAGQSVAASDLGKLRWTPEDNAFGDDLASIGFKVVDNGGTANGGANTDPTPDTITFDVSDVADVFIGTRRGDRLRGTDGVDTLISRRGNDSLRARGGDDILIGGAGNEKLWSGTGADTFIYGGGGRDRIMDFETGVDAIDLTRWSAIADFADLRRHAANKDGDLWIVADEAILIIENFRKADLDPDDFLF